MTKDQLAKALQMRAEGKTYAQIGAALGYTRQHIYKMLGKPQNSRFGRSPKPCCDVYPALALWLIEHRCSYDRLAELTGTSYGAVNSMMNGYNDPSKRLIDNILAVTGLTYEQAFGGGKQ